jgi:ERCC4-type nuclease
MLIKVDYRDADLYAKCADLLATNVEKYASCIQLIKENIPLGDVIIYDGTGNCTGKEKIIIERKSLSDLAASIRDGRYAEQSFRLNESSLHNHTIYYAIEGDLRTYKPFQGKGVVDKKTLLSSMVSMSYFKGFSVHRTINIDETAEWIVQFAYKLHKEGVDAKCYYVQTQQQEQTQLPTQEYAEVCKNNRIKKNNITPDNIGAIMLSQIPNVSSGTATTIIEKFGNITLLIKALNESTTALDGISSTTKNGQSRKISKTSIANIYTYLVPAGAALLAPVPAPIINTN